MDYLQQRHFKHCWLLVTNVATAPIFLAETPVVRFTSKSPLPLRHVFWGSSGLRNICNLHFLPQTGVLILAFQIELLLLSRRWPLQTFFQENSSWACPITSLYRLLLLVFFFFFPTCSFIYFSLSLKFAPFLGIFLDSFKGIQDIVKITVQYRGRKKYLQNEGRREINYNSEQICSRNIYIYFIDYF